MKDQSVAAAIVLLAIAVFFVGGTRPSSPQPADQYVVKDGMIFRFPAAVPGRIEFLTKDSQSRYVWAGE